MLATKLEWEAIELAMRLILDYLDVYPLCTCEPDFEDDLLCGVADLIELQIEPALGSGATLLTDLADTVECALDLVKCMGWLSRQEATSPGPPLTKSAVQAIRGRIGSLRSIPQPEQRTEEWYAFRKTYITASSAWKAFGSQAALNQLIYDKCQPPSSGGGGGGGGVSIDSPLHWGQKYEPLSVMWYEREYETRVGEFGCIPHPSLACLAASPDGINVDPANPRYGRMLEIKNVVSREITGVPKKDYWIQMQLQMAVCGLSECDFLEMKFEEYEDEDAFLADGTGWVSEQGKLKGRILHFQVDGSPSYEYQPLGLSDASAEAWRMATVLARDNDTWVQDIYWRLDVVSCVLVRFDERWMKAAGNRLTEVWRMIQAEKISGCEHRAPRKRMRQDSAPEPPRRPQCLLTVSRDGRECEPVNLEEVPSWLETEEPPTGKRKLIHIDTMPLSGCRGKTHRNSL